MLGCQGLDHGGVPDGLAFAQGVAEDEEFAHAGRQRHLGRLAGRDQPLVEGPETGGDPGRRQGGHVQHGADRGTPAPDAAATALADHVTSTELRRFGVANHTRL